MAPTAKVLLRFRASPLIARDAEIAVARVYTTGLFRIAKGDVVSFWKASSSTKAGTVHLHLSVHGACKNVVSPCAEGSRDGRLMHCTETGEYVIIDSSDLSRSAIYARTANVVDVILKPDEVSR